MSETCRVQWVNDNGEPTPDTNPAEGYAVLTRTYSRGPSAGHTEVTRIPCCGNHRLDGIREGIFGRREHFSGQVIACISEWSFEPIP